MTKDSKTEAPTTGAEMPTTKDHPTGSRPNEPLSKEPTELNTRAGLADLDLADVPSLEILILDGIANWIFSPANPGKSYQGEHGGDLVSAVLNAAHGAARFRPVQVPAETAPMAEMRRRLIDGAHEIATGAGALSMFVITLMPAVISELERRSGDPASQLYWIYCYALLVVAGGSSGGLDQNLTAAIMASFDGWNELMAQGFTLPWRAA